MSGSLMIDALMVVLTIVTICAAFAPLLLLPKWMTGKNARRIDFHRSAIAVIDTELARPQTIPGQADRLLAERQYNVAALRSLVPTEVVPPVRAAVDKNRTVAA